MKTAKILLIMSTILTATSACAQFSDDFSDGNHNANPTWSGDVSRFVVNSEKLKLQAPAVSESAFLTVPSQAMHNASWEFYLQMDFAPSSTNYAKIYLVSDQADLNHALNGYFIKAGNTSRDISLYRQNGTVETKIIDGLDDRINVTVVKVRIKAIRNELGVWQLFSDTGVNGNYISEGSITDTINTVSSWFGIQCVYRATRSDKFWFDDFNIAGVPIPDTTPPEILTVVAPGPRQIDVLFSEPLQETSIQTGNFLLRKTETPLTIDVADDKRTLSLHFAQPMKNGETCTLTVSNVKDISGNTLLSADASFQYFQPVSSHYKDIIFTELFPDGSPQIGLPNLEFAEIYNRSDAPFNLNGWKLSDGSSTGIFPSQIILPGEYWIITSISSVGMFKSFGKTIGLANFPTLNNSSDSFILKNADNTTIDSVFYNLDSYRDIDKQEGGWTLELIDVMNPCGEQDNWTASEDVSGGTPGRQNSVFANKPDTSAPVVQSVFATTSDAVIVTFNEKLDAASLTKANFLIEPLQLIDDVAFVDKSRRSIQLRLTNELHSRTTYSLKVSNVIDCNQNAADPLIVNFGLAEKADSLDVVINEILFNPRSGGVDFVEVLNASDKYINLKDIRIANYKDDRPANTISLFVNDVLLSPGAFAVFTTSPELLKLQYARSIDRNLFKTSLPSLPDDEGSVAIVSDDGRVIDQVSYSKEWHSVFIKNDEGVSLERISSSAPSNDSNNWTSASATVGFATPGYANSQRKTESELVEESVVVEPEIFYPDSPDGFVRIQYHFETAPVANVKVFDIQGHLLRTVARNETLASEGFFRWDGDRDDGSRARTGYYIVWFEIFDESGSAKVFRKRAIISSR